MATITISSKDDEVWSIIDTKDFDLDKPLSRWALDNEIHDAILTADIYDQSQEKENAH